VRKLAALAETSPLNRVESGSRTDIGVITSGASYQYVKEAFGDSVSVLKLGMVNPLPEELIRGFAARFDKVCVVEELDPVIENHCRGLGLTVTGKEIFPICDEYSQNLVARTLGKEIPRSTAFPEEIPARPPVMCAGCPHRGMFYALKQNGATVIGDIGCYTLAAAAPLMAMDTTICMGASVSGLHGFTHASGNTFAEKAVAVIGDSTFMHSGVTGLINMAYNGGTSTVVILDNSTTGMTGQQQNPTTGLNIKGDPAGKIDLVALCRAVGIHQVSVVDPYNLAACDAALKEGMAAGEPSVIISRRPCALLKTVKHKPPLHVDPERCKSCKSCMKIGCPAISMKRGPAAIDHTLCVGCGVCTQLCRFDAFEEGVE
jgi:indolepyruvate ferredoxin oxidoreductase alpha subunit